MKEHIESVRAWLKDRTAYEEGMTPGNSPISRGDSVFHLSAFALGACFALQAITGVFLSMYYSPSVTDAWGSVWYIQTQVTWGGIVRGLHFFGASAMVVIGVVHLIALYTRAAYKRKGELVWYSGILVLFITFAFGLTGYLLPFDQMGYWASQVRTGIVGSLPFIGTEARTLLIGGTEFGNLTLTRFSTLHSMVLPTVTIGILALHFRTLRVREQTLPEENTPDISALLGFLKVLMAGVVLAVLLTISLLIDAPLEPPADPTSTFEARPEWYFLFLFQLLKYFEGPMALIGTVVLPGLGTGFLFALPFLDKNPHQPLRHRIPWTALFASIFVFAGAMSGVALWEDAHNADFQKAWENQAHDAQEALRLAPIDSIGVDGKIAAYSGYKLFDSKGCLGCHGIQGRTQPDEKLAPALDGYLSREWFRSFLLEPDSERFFGSVPAGEDTEWDMPGIHSEDIDLQGEESLTAIVEWLAAQSGRPLVPPVNPELAAQGRALVEDEACSACHSLDGEEVDGPALTGYGSEIWLKTVIRTPHKPEFFGERNSMPEFTDLSDAEISLLIRYLHTLP